ncbi:MAG: M81 family metallopeptidase [Pirellulales bacterium]
MRVGIIGLQHESNTFQSAPTTWEHFEQGALLAGQGIVREYGAAHHEVGGFFHGLDEEGLEAVPIFFAWAMPGGPVTSRTLEKLLQAMLVQLKAAGNLDGILVAPHGAGVSESRPDMDGAWLRELRSRVGPQMPIVGTLDLHANLSHEMLQATDALIAYRTNPHLDQRQRGQEAARLMARILRGEVRPTHAAAWPPLAINIDRQDTGATPCRECYEALDDMLADKRVLSNSLLLGFPYADVPEMGASVIVTTNDDPDLARQLADEFAEYLRLRRSHFVGQTLDVDAAIVKAMQLRGPVCLLDMGDNVGGGSPGDGTLLLHALVRHGVAKAFVSLYDPTSVQLAVRAGVGRSVELQLGGKVDARHGEPFVAKVRVRGLYDGSFSESQPRHGGRLHYDMGPTVVADLEGGQTVMLTSRRIAPFSLQQLTSCGVDPRHYQVVVAKGVHAPVAAYAPVCPTMVRVNTPGVTAADMTRLEYHRRRKPLFPFEA